MAAPSRRGSAVVLAGLALLFLALFGWQRARSSFLRIEAREAELAAIAADQGLSLPTVMALCDALGDDGFGPRLATAVAVFARQLAAGRDEAAALAALALAPRAQRRFVMLRERFRSRH